MNTREPAPTKPLLPQGAELVAPVPRGVVYLVLVLALAATLLPWSDSLRWLVPDFTLMALLYWNIHAPRLAGLGTAFVLGLVTDVARGLLIGLNALSYCVAAFIVLTVQRRLENFDAPRQTLQLTPIILGKEVLVLTLGLVFGRGEADWRWLAAGVVGSLLWAPLAMLLNRLTGRPTPVIQETT